jgi:two-component system chemotaxis response regulator CheY
MAKKILVVDDSKTVRQQVRHALVDAGYAFEEAENGEQGLRSLRACRDIAMVISDINMPVMNGIAMLEKIALEKLAANTPIVVLTTEGQPDLIERAKKLGAKGWILKPFKPDLLVATARKLAGNP